MDFNWKNYLVDFELVDSEKILENWSWLIGPKKKLLYISTIGNFFFTDIFGHLYWVCPGDASVERIADDVDNFKMELQEKEDLREWFRPSLIKKLKASGLKLSKNQVYGIIEFPTPNYNYNLSSFEVRDLQEYFQEIAEKLKDIKGW